MPRLCLSHSRGAPISTCSELGAPTRVASNACDFSEVWTVSSLRTVTCYWVSTLLPQARQWVGGHSLLRGWTDSGIPPPVLPTCYVFLFLAFSLNIFHPLGPIQIDPSASGCQNWGYLKCAIHPNMTKKNSHILCLKYEDHTISSQFTAIQ